MLHEEIFWGIWNRFKSSKSFFLFFHFLIQILVRAGRRDRKVQIMKSIAVHHAYSQNKKVVKNQVEVCKIRIYPPAVRQHLLEGIYSVYLRFYPLISAASLTQGILFHLLLFLRVLPTLLCIYLDSVDGPLNSKRLYSFKQNYGKQIKRKKNAKIQ